MSVEPESKSGDGLREILKLGIQVLVTVLIIRTLVFEPFQIPSGSMLPTLAVGDFVWVSKLSYGYSRWSLPFWHPRIQGRLFGALPARGDVVVFRLPRDPSENIIKRIIGLPGDTVQMIDNHLYLNEEPVPARAVDDFIDPDDPDPHPIHRFIESLPPSADHPGADHPILDDPAQVRRLLDNTPKFTVPPGQVFAMGDNRSNSIDSRDMTGGGVGFVPLDNLVGRAEFRLFSLAPVSAWWAIWEWPSAIRYSRLFTAVR